jgi:putative flippase GtrA
MLSIIVAEIKKFWGWSPTHHKSTQIFRSIAVSFIALLCDFSLLIVFKEFGGLHYLLAALLSFCAGVYVNYLLSNKWVFAHRQLESKNKEFVLFFVISAIGLSLNLGIIYSSVQFLNFDYRVAKVVAAAVVFFWNFLMRKKLLY